jgi:ATP adenylyltransferase
MVYVAGAQAPRGCIFCPAREEDRRAAHILSENDGAIVILNRYPYASGHLLVAPRRHAGAPGDLTADEFAALARALQGAIRAVEAEYRPHGMNVGMNLGRPAGAGIEDHLHWHVVPRWNGDTNFMPVLADIRVLPEHLDATYERLLPHFHS